MVREDVEKRASFSAVVLNEQGLEISPQDDRTHRVLQLPNGMKVLLSSDPKAEKAAAAMGISVGAGADPPTFPGLAHFCEHMLFLGTEKYPEENAYKKYLASHSGRSNASTSMERTVYQFEVASEHFYGALDIFSQFFVAPLFTESATERELNAVDAEDSKNRCDDGRRLLQVMRALGDPQHPYSKFSTGNLKTLREDVPSSPSIREVLMAFHALHYTASNMCLALCGSEPLDTLEDWVHELFGAVRTEKAAVDVPGSAHAAAAEGAHGLLSSRGGPPELGGHPFWPPFGGPRAQQAAEAAAAAAAVTGRQTGPSDDWPLLYELLPMRDIRELALKWPLPSTRGRYRGCALQLISHLLGHEGEGTVFAELQDRGWATSLSAGSSHEDVRFTMFQVRITLTPLGEENWPHVVALTLQYLRLLQNISEPELLRHFQEVQSVSAIAFQFQQKSKPYDFAQSMARNLSTCTHLQHCLSKGYILEEISHSEFLAVTSFMADPRELLIGRLSRYISRSVPGGVLDANVDVSSAGELQGAELERWYGVSFRRGPVPKEVQASLGTDTSNKLHLPAPNHYIPDDLSLRMKVRVPNLEGLPTLPVVLRDDIHGRLWHKLDDRYVQPRVEIYLLLRSVFPVEDNTLAGLLCAYMTSRLKQTTYAASIAGLNWSLSNNNFGLLLNVSGYSQRAPDLLLNLLDTLLKGPWDGEAQEACQIRFDGVKDRAERALRSWKMQRPDAHANYYIDTLLRPDSRLIRERLEQTEKVVLEDVQSFHSRFFERVYIESFVIGNAVDSEATQLHEAVLGRLQQGAGTSGAPIPALPVEEFKVVRRTLLSESRTDLELLAAVQNDSEENSGFVLYLEGGFDPDLKHQAALRMIAQVMREPCFNQLRTQQQLGYIVASNLDVDFAGNKRVEGLLVTVVSKQFSPEVIQERVDQFFESFREILLATGEGDGAKWAAYKSAFLNNFLLPPKTLSNEADTHWPLIRRRAEEADWSWRSRLAAVIQELTLQETVAFYDQLIKATTRHRVAALVYGKGRAVPEETAPETVGPRRLLAEGSAFQALRQALPLAGSKISNGAARQLQAQL